jgi:cysteine synthase
MPRPHDSVLDTIGRTPVVRLSRLAPEGIDLYAKLEAFNPMGSVKDRLARALIEDAERSGALRPGQTVIEATSGNTGIGLAMVCAAKGYPLVVVMAENFSVERRRLMRYLGARVVLTPAAEKGSGMLAKAVELAEAHGWFLARQFESPANAAIHARTTAREILADFRGRRLDWFVTGAGTGGTLAGVSRVLRARRPETRIAVAEPDNAPMLASGDHTAGPGSHPAFRPHLMQGWSPDFVPAITRDALAAGAADRIVGVSGADALGCARDLARREGIFCGITGGAGLAAALAIARTAPRGTSLLFMVPDTGERYLSTPLFADVPEAMTPEEQEIAASTPGFRIGGACRLPAALAPAAPGPEEAPPSARGIRAVEEAIAGSDREVVVFALEWCEFCWSLRRFFAAAGIPFRSIDLDSRRLDAGGLGGEIRHALRARIGQPTIPQVFVGGHHLGGSTDTLDAWKLGRLQELLAANGIPFRPEAAPDPRAFLPGWVHPR